jgi:hypothetical protein
MNWETSTTMNTLPLRDAIPPLKSPAPQAAALPMPHAIASVSVLIIDPLSFYPLLLPENSNIDHKPPFLSRH